jgi:hypothetical protein
MGHLIHVVVIVCVATMYRLVINHGSMLDITGLEVLCTIFIPKTEMTSLPLLNASLPPEARTSPG